MDLDWLIIQNMSGPAAASWVVIWRCEPGHVKGVNIKHVKHCTWCTGDWNVAFVTSLVSVVCAAPPSSTPARGPPGVHVKYTCHYSSGVRGAFSPHPDAEDAALRRCRAGGSYKHADPGGKGARPGSGSTEALAVTAALA